MRAIDADALIESLRGVNHIAGLSNIGIVIEMVKRRPAVTERTAQMESGNFGIPQCNQCKDSLGGFEKYCPSCGARFVEAHHE